MPQLTVIPAEVILTCKNDMSTTKVRLRTSDKISGVNVSALGYDHAIVSLEPAEEIVTNDNGFVDIVVRCKKDGPCPASTTVTFDAQGYDSCALKINCSDRKKEGEGAVLPPADLAKQAAAAELAGQDADNLATSHLAEAQTDTDDICKACDAYISAAHSYELAANGYAAAGNAQQAATMKANAVQCNTAAANRCKRCGDRKLESGEFQAAEQSLLSAIEALEKLGNKDDAAKIRDIQLKATLEAIKRTLEAEGIPRSEDAQGH